MLLAVLATTALAGSSSPEKICRFVGSGFSGAATVEARVTLTTHGRWLTDPACPGAMLVLAEDAGISRIVIENNLNKTCTVAKVSGTVTDSTVGGNVAYLRGIKLAAIRAVPCSGQ